MEMKIEKNFLIGLGELVTPECGERPNLGQTIDELKRTIVLANSNKIVSYSELHADHKKYEAEWESNMQYSASHN